MKNCNYYTYIMTNKGNNVFYIGISRNLRVRVWEHKIKQCRDSFTARYNLNKLIWFQQFNSSKEAIANEKRLKRWHRDWKIDLIRKFNPRFNDLSVEWYEKDQF